MKRFIFVVLALALVAAGFFSYRLLSKKTSYTYEQQRVLMGTLFEIVVYEEDCDREKVFQILQNGFSEVARLEKVMNDHLPENLLMQVAKYAGSRSVAVPSDVMTVINKAMAVSSETEGAFDITFKPLGRLWNVTKSTEPPEKELIQERIGLVDYRKVHLDIEKKTVYLTRPGMEIGLGGIAKGYATQKAAEILRREGMQNFIINGGGDLYVSGRKGKVPWVCGVRNPDEPENILIRMKIKRNCAVVTSGNYERYFIHNGKRYHHIIDPSTGYPAEGMKSVTVFADDPSLADAYATAFFILGYEKSKKIQEHHHNLAFIMIDENNIIHESNNIVSFAEIIR